MKNALLYKLSALFMLAQWLPMSPVEAASLNDYGKSIEFCDLQQNTGGQLIKKATYFDQNPGVRGYQYRDALLDPQVQKCESFMGFLRKHIRDSLSSLKDHHFLYGIFKCFDFYEYPEVQKLVQMALKIQPLDGSKEPFYLMLFSLAVDVALEFEFKDQGEYKQGQRTHNEKSRKSTGGDQEMKSKECSRNEAYATLGLGLSAAPRDVAKAYRSLAKKYHPDNKKDGDEGQFLVISAAYECLKKD